MARIVALGMVNVLLQHEPLAERRREVLRLVDEAGRSGCQIVLLPEYSDHHATREAIAALQAGLGQYRKVAGLNMRSPWMREIASLARKYRMVVIPDVMLIEGSQTANTAVVFGPKGVALGRYSKTHLPPGGDGVCKAGDSIETVATPFGKIGLLICWDIHFPELTRVHELQGADILLWTSMRQVESEDILWRAILPARCCEHGLPLGVATYVTRHQAPLRKPMTSAIFNAFGQIVAGGMLTQGIVRADLDLDARPLERRDWGSTEWVDAGPHFRRCRRPDLYGAIVKPLPRAEKAPTAGEYPDLVSPVL